MTAYSQLTRSKLRQGLRRWALTSIDMVQRTFDSADDDWEPVLLVGRLPEEFAAVGMDAGLLAEPDIFHEALRMQVVGLRADAVAVVASTWFYDATAQESRLPVEDLPTADEHPSRREGLLVVVADALQQEIHRREFVRDPKPHLIGQWQEEHEINSAGVAGQLIPVLRSALQEREAAR